MSLQSSRAARANAEGLIGKITFLFKTSYMLSLVPPACSLPFSSMAVETTLPSSPFSLGDLSSPTKTPKRSTGDGVPLTPPSLAAALDAGLLWTLSPGNSPLSSPTPAARKQQAAANLTTPGRNEGDDADNGDELTTDPNPSSEMSILDLATPPGKRRVDVIRNSVRIREERRAAEKADLEEQSVQRKKDILRATLRSLWDDHKLTFGDLVHFVSDPLNWQGEARWRGFFSVPGRVEEVLSWWASSSSNSNTGRETMREWAVTFTQGLVESEGNAATEAGFLQTPNKTIDRTFALQFSLPRIHEKLELYCPTAMAIFNAFSTTTRQKKKMSELAIQRKRTVRTFVPPFVPTDLTAL